MKNQVFVSSATDEITSVIPGCLHELFEAKVKQSPNAPALITSSEVYSYGLLNEKANQFARYLRAMGIQRGSLVGIYMERSTYPIIAILGSLKAGAGYVPIDPSFPADRIKYILEETNAAALLSESVLVDKVKGVFPKTIVQFDKLDLGAFANDNLPSDELSAQPEDLCYLIYTSGTTGRPKGVMAEHRNAYLYTLAFNKVCGTGPEDRIFQGFSLSFDGSIEEIWMAFSNGSALVVPNRDTAKFGAELGQFLTKMGVTYFSTVPTLLSTIPDAIPSMKILVVSGEVCPVELVNRWATPSLRMLNVYGPTEATVNTSAFECKPGKTITIGKPLPGYDIYILNEQMQPVPRGEKGELYVGGRTLARGYFAREDLTAKQFIQHVGEINGVKNPRLYKTGDSVRWNSEGELEFFGRIDLQVKIRGYRVELSELEAILLEHPNISTAAVKLVEQDGLQELAAYVIRKDPGLELDRNEILTTFESRVPPYMVPGYLEVLPDFPMLASGKTDRNRLPKPVSPLVKQKGEIIAPATPMEEKLAQMWSELFSLPQISVEDNFFLDLGGHSLMAAKLATKIRDVYPGQFAIKDIYSKPTVRLLAAHLDAARAKPVTEQTERTLLTSQENFQLHSKKTFHVVAALQLVGAYLIHSLTAAPLAAMLVAQMLWINERISTEIMLSVLFFASVGRTPALLAVGLLAKWLIIGRYKAGTYPLWGFYYFRWWLVNRIQAMTPVDILTGTPLLASYFRAMGARIGRDVTLDTSHICTPDLLTLGDYVSVGADSHLLGYKVENGMLVLGSIKIDHGSFVGIHSALGVNTKMGANSALDDQSYLPDGDSIDAGEKRRGSPAKAFDVQLPALPPRRKRPVRQTLFYALVHLAQIAVLEITVLLPTAAITAMVALARYKLSTGAGILAIIASVPAGFAVYALYIVALKRLVLNQAQPGVYSTQSIFYLRKWFTDKLIKQSKLVLLPMYTTLYFPHWLRLMGAKIGKRAEISVLGYYSPDLIEMGEESFFADSSIIGGKRFHQGYFQIARNKIGKRSFVGNGSFLPVGGTIGDNCLLGVTSTPPTLHTPSGTDWLGSPAFMLPHRDKVGGFDAKQLFQPTKGMYALRSLVDAGRIVIPGYIQMLGFLICTGLFSFLLRHEMHWASVLVMVPVMGLALGLFNIVSVGLLKVISCGEFKPVIKPLWSPYVWVNEALNGIYETVMAPSLVPFMGTPFAAPLMRLVGCRIGKRVYIESSLFSEFDMVHIGNYAAINRGSMLQNHLFEDRIMKSSHAHVKENCNVGNMAIVLYDGTMEAGSTLGSLSLVMKGETLAKDSTWHGIPTIPMDPPAAKAEAKPAAYRVINLRTKERPASMPAVAKAQKAALKGAMPAKAKAKATAASDYLGPKH
jgi:non-ribosomal peptide synthetase-like protein